MIELQTKIQNLPEKSGCYIYLNKNGEVIYVGKAKNLKKRVTSYFNRVHNIKTTRLVRNIVDLNYFVVNNEKEALLLEENLIKKHHPKYNILLNDDKAYPYIVVTNENDPQYKYVRKFDKKYLKSYGPLPQGTSARKILGLLEQTYPLRRCKGNLGQPCFYYSIGQCSGACFKKVDHKYYQDQIQKISRFFAGNIASLGKDLVLKMHLAADNLQFEHAQRIKDLIKSFSFVVESNNVELNDHKNRDVLAFEFNHDQIAITMLFYRGGKLLNKDQIIADYNEQDLDEILDFYLAQIYKKNMIPDELILPKELNLNDLPIQIKTIATHPINKIEKNLMSIAIQNTQEFMRVTNLNQRTAINREAQILDELSVLLDVREYLHHIEMFDISNIGDEFVTGGVVVYKNGKPDRNSFRKYNIEISERDDLHRLQYLLSRRYQKMLDEKTPLPNLIIIDGGLVHVQFAKQVLNALKLAKIPVIGLSKDDHHKTNELIDVQENIIKLERKSQIYNFLSGMQIRVDAYAKAGFRKKQNNQLLTNSLLKVEGLGEKKIQSLFKIFPTIDQMKNCSFDQLNQVIKNKNTTKNLMHFLNSNV
ncbi:excinuclease ABC subunit C [Williamsoniiplasma luminosum]|uniref:UvrABC system protein C n=1 Tax=Williamsoniiplasma luminosum TaxID=214888 RepID=A0A2K8NVB4_9MOLU|nr:excinuclease ABC subunit UvrC [Williamsoniiplasma luminosum]ATZ17486.1 excinuclease ABC subunit C [Williamsoniiplasma luminosum]